MGTWFSITLQIMKEGKGDGRSMLDKIKQMDRKTVKRILFGLSFFVLAFYVGGLLTQIFKDAGSIRFNPFSCLYYGMFTLTGLKNTVLSLFLFLIIGGVVIYRGSAAGDQMDEERNFEYSKKGTYGTAGYMTKEERANPGLINPSRKQRIAKGAGVDVSEVNRLVKQFDQMKKMMKQMPGLMGGGKRKGLGGLGGLMGGKLKLPF